MVTDNQAEFPLIFAYNQNTRKLIFLNHFSEIILNHFSEKFLRNCFRNKTNPYSTFFQKKLPKTIVTFNSILRFPRVETTLAALFHTTDQQSFHRVEMFLNDYLHLDTEPRNENRTKPAPGPIWRSRLELQLINRSRTRQRKFRKILAFYNIARVSNLLSLIIQWNVKLHIRGIETPRGRLSRARALKTFIRFGRRDEYINLIGTTGTVKPRYSFLVFDVNLESFCVNWITNSMTSVTVYYSRLVATTLLLRSTLTWIKVSLIQIVRLTFCIYFI